MIKERLKPHVHKIKGKHYYAFYDILNGRFFRISPGETLEELRRCMKEEGLVFQSENIVPFKIEMDVMGFVNRVQLRSLQIRLNGKAENNCWQHQVREDSEFVTMEDEVIDCLSARFAYLPVRKMRIEAQTADPDKMGKILETISAQAVEIYVKEGLSPEQAIFLKNKSKAKNVSLTIIEEGRWDIQKLRVEVFYFFYTQKFNPCLGHQVAVDPEGNIKPCLWSEDALGNISTHNLKDMVIGGVFDPFWEITKDRIEGCKECEKRFNCNDCRISVQKNQGAIEKKPTFCVDSFV